jgi:hypothetical protein
MKRRLRLHAAVRDLLPPFDPLGCARYAPGVLARNVAGLVELRGHWCLQPRPSLDLPQKTSRSLLHATLPRMGWFGLMRR